MAYKVKYRLDYCNKEKLNARLDFEIKDYTSTIIHDIVGTQNAFSYKVRNEKSDRSGYFRTLEADINIFEDENFNIDNLLTSDETAIRVKVYIENQLEFVGFIIPDFFEVSIDKPRVISMVASDRIGTLKNQTLPRQTGVQSYRYMLEQSLLKTGLDLTINSTINFNPVGETGDFLTKTGGLMERLSSDKGASISCYDIIKSILIVSNSFLLQEKGQWHILNKLEFESRPTTKDIEQINVGGRRLINPPSSKVGVMAEFGGGLKYPENYDFDSLNSWTEHNGYIATLNNKIIEGYSNGVPIYGGTAKNTNLLNKNGIYVTETNPRRLESDPISVISSNPNRASVTFEVGVTIPQGATTIFHVYARKGNLYKVLTRDGFEDVSVSKLYNKTLNVSKDNESYDLNVAVEISSSFDGIIEDLDGEVTQWKIYTSSLGNFSDDITSFINRMSLSFNAQTEQKGNLFKIEQGVNFTKESEIDTTIFGDFINKGVNGYFYNYQRDEQSSIFYKIGSNWEQFGLGWQDQTQTPLTADRILLHSVRQRAIMFSSPHNIITAIVKGKFSALDIYSVCGIKYVLVEAEYNFYRNETELRIEEVKYDNSVLKTDYIYSYFGGEDTTSISGVSSVGSSSGGGGSSFQSLIKIDEDGNYYVEENFYSLKDVSAFGKDDLGGGGGDGVALTSWVDQITTLTDFNQNTKFIKQSEVVDNLTTNDPLKPLSAKQGSVLKALIDNIAGGGGEADSVAWTNVIGRPTNLSQFTNDSGFITASAITGKVDKVTGKSLISDSEISRLSTVTNQTATSIGLGNVTNESKAVMFANPTFTGTVSGVTKSMVGLSNVDNVKQATKAEFDNFVALRNNPHEVTKAQVGLGNVTNESKSTMFTDPTFTGTTKVTVLQLNTNWKFVKVGNNIELQYNGVTKQELTSDGHIISHGDVTALLQ